MISSLILSFKDLALKKVFIIAFICSLISSIFLLSIFFFIWSLTPSLGWVGTIFIEWFAPFYLSFWFFIFGSITVVFYPTMVTIICSLFLDSISRSIEEKHYPNIIANNNEGITSGFFAGIRLLGWSIMIFLIFAPIMWVTINNIYIAFLFWSIISGYVISREYYEVSAHRIMTYSDANRFRKANILSIWLNGLICFIFFMIPLLNLFAPILSIIFMTHEIQRIIKKNSEIIEYTN